MFFRARAGPNVSQRVQVPVLRYSSTCKTMFRCQFLAIVDVRTIYRCHAKNASPDKWCLNEKVELLCKLAMPRLSSGVLNEKVELLYKLAMPRLSSGV